jgi:hypothetical protein
MNKVLKSAASLLICLVGATAVAGDDCCQRCGDSQCKKVCRLVCEVKKVPVVTYTCECEDFCIPHRSQRCGTKCECDENGCPVRKPNDVPTSARQRTRKKLVKHVTEKEVKVYKWVVETVCNDCCHPHEQPDE